MFLHEACMPAQLALITHSIEKSYLKLNFNRCWMRAIADYSNSRTRPGRSFLIPSIPCPLSKTPRTMVNTSTSTAAPAANTAPTVNPQNF